MKKQFFVKKYPIFGDFEVTTTQLVPTIEVDFDEIERSLPSGATIKHSSVQTIVEGNTLIVYGEYTTTQTVAEEVIAREEVIEELLNDEENLPSVN